MARTLGRVGAYYTVGLWHRGAVSATCQLNEACVGRAVRG